MCVVKPLRYYEAKNKIKDFTTTCKQFQLAYNYFNLHIIKQTK